MYAEILAYVKAKSLTVYLTDVSPSKPLESEQVIFAGYQSNPYKFIKNATILIIASTAEGGPNVIQESMICETLVVSTDCPSGPREIIAPDAVPGKLDRSYVGDYGVLLPMIMNNRYEETIDHWATVIEEYFINEQKREALVKNAKKWVSKQSAKDIVEQWEKII